MRLSPPTDPKSNCRRQNNGGHTQASRPPSPIRPAGTPGDHGGLVFGAVVYHPDRVPARQVSQLGHESEVGGHPSNRVPAKIGPDVAPGTGRPPPHLHWLGSPGGVPDTNHGRSSDRPVVHLGGGLESPAG